MKQLKRLTLLIIFPIISYASFFSPKDIANLKQHFIKNITSQGAVMASPSRSHPDYYYHWVRDGAISMSLIARWYDTNPTDAHLEKLKNYVRWVEQAQQQVLSEGNNFGEPKFYLDGRIYDKPWGRPQNDGPALRAITLTTFAKHLLKDQKASYVKKHLYQASLDSSQMGVIKRDLEYTAKHWQDKHFDLWEESFGHHFFSSVVARKALIEGASLAGQLNDPMAQTYYLEQAQRIERFLLSFVDLDNQVISCSLDAIGPVKHLNLDTSVILAFLYIDNQEPLLKHLAPFFDGTAKKLSEYFHKEYAINYQYQDAFLFGRYPGDSYDGYETNAKGNPWFILTTTMASFHFKKALMLNTSKEKGSIKERQRGELYLEHVKHYITNNHLSEQINRDSGDMQGATNLTWSYQSLLTALKTNEDAITAIKLHPRLPDTHQHNAQH